MAGVRLDKIRGAVTKAILSADLMYDAVVYRNVVTQDDSGNTTMVPTALPCRALIEKASYTQRQGEGFVEGDVQVIIMRETLETRRVEPEDEFVCLGGPWAGDRWTLTGKDGDPVGATIVMAGKSR